MTTITLEVPDELAGKLNVLRGRLPGILPELLDLLTPDNGTTTAPSLRYQVFTEMIDFPASGPTLVACINSFASRRSGIVRRAASLSSPFMLVLSIFDKLAARRTITSEVSVTSN